MKSGIFTPGVSKHAEKEIARQQGAKTWSDLGRHLHIYSYRTAQTYKDVWHQFGHFVRDELGVRNMQALSGGHVKAYLESRIADGVKYSTFQKEAAALSKLENALNMFSKNVGSERTYDFRSYMTEVRKEAAEVLERFQETRAYADPKSLIENISSEKYQLAAQIQYEGGARIYEASLIHRDQLEGLGKDSVTGKEVGMIRLDPADTKGGKEREIHVSPATYEALKRHIETHGEFRIENRNDYYSALREAAKNSGQDYHGSHGLRWNFAQERFSELQQHGYTHEQSLAQVSWEMGHERADITLHYLR